MEHLTTTLSRDDLRRHLERGRTYVWPPNDPAAREYLSVTNVLNSIPKPALPRWAAKLTAETAVEKLDLLNTLVGEDPTAAVNWLKQAPWGARDRAADIGTAIHEIVEKDALGDAEAADAIAAQLPPEGRDKARQARDFFTKADLTVDHVEFVCYHHELGYAGTGDFIVTLGSNFQWNWPGITKPNPKLILDLKTGSGVYPEAAAQMSAYRFASDMVDLRSAEMTPMPETDGAAVLHVTDKSWSLLPVDASAATFDAFKAALRLAHYLPLDRMWIGTPIVRGRA